MNRGLSEEQKEQLAKMMNSYGFDHTESFIRNKKDEWAFETQMWCRSNLPFELTSTLSMQFSHSPENEFRDYPLINGGIVVGFGDPETHETCFIGAIHTSLIVSLEQEHMKQIIIDEWTKMAELSKEFNVKWFGDFNVTKAFLELALENEQLAQAVRDVNLVYTNLPDFVCGTEDYIPIEIEEQFGEPGENRIGEVRDGKSRQVLTLCKAAGTGINIYSLHHPITFEDMMSKTYEQVAEYSRNLNFSESCFDHMTLFCNAHFE